MASRTILAETHVLGSLRGYGTVAASRGVGAEESRELESFQFGDASTAERIARLETHAVMTGRALRSGRFAVSRMMPAGFDDAGRPTVEVITLLFEPRDLGFVAGALGRLASDAEFWRTARATVGDGARVEADDGGAEDAARDPRVLRLFDLWRAAVRDGAVGVVPESESASVLALAAALDPSDRARLRWGIGLLSLSAPVDLCSVASGTSLHGARAALRPAAEGAWHCGEESEYAEFRASSGRAHLPSLAEIESQGRTRVFEDDDARRTHARSGGRGGADGAGVEDRRARRLMPLAIGSAALSTVVLAFALTMWNRRENAAAVEVPVFAPSIGGSGAARDGLADPLAGEMPKPPAVVGETKTEVALEEKAGEPGNEAKVAPPKETGGSENPQTSASEGDASAPPEDPPPSEGGEAGGDTSPPSGPADPPSGGTLPTAEGEAVKASPAVDAMNKLLELLKQDRPPIRVPPPSRDFGNELRSEEQRAVDLAREVAQQVCHIAKLDAESKRTAKDLQRQGQERAAVEAANGFIATRAVDVSGAPRIGDSPRPLLNRDAMCKWQEVLKKIESLRPLLGGAEAQARLRLEWNKGVADGAQGNEPAAIVTRSLLEFGDKDNLTIELNTINALLGPQASTTQ